MKVVIIGPAHPLRGGLATFNQRLAKQFLDEGHDCEIVSFSLQYPAIFFPGKTQYSSDPAPASPVIRSIINSVNPLNWIIVGNKLREEKADIIVVRFWIPYMGPSLGTILRIAGRNRHTKIVCIADNIIPHEHRAGDRTFTRYFLRSVDAFITMSEKVFADLRKFEKKKPALLVRHPLYDSFGDILSKEEARKKLQLDPNQKIVLFFGFIRRYKGLDLLLDALKDERLQQQNIKVLIAGEFYEDEKIYKQMIIDNNVSSSVILHNHFIPDNEVRYYLCASDCVVQPYRDATQSGVTPLAYHFERPMIVTNVGGLPDLVPHMRSGIVCEPEPSSIASAIVEFYTLGENYFIPHLRSEKKKYAWSNLTEAIRSLAGR